VVRKVASATGRLVSRSRPMAHEDSFLTRCGPTNRWTRAAVGDFVRSKMRLRLDGIAPPRQLHRSTPCLNAKMTAMRHVLLLVVIFASCVASVIGQNAGKLKGKVLDNRHRPIIASTIMVFNAQNKFTVAANDDTG